MAVASDRTLTVSYRTTSGDIKEITYKYIKGDATGVQMKTALQTLFSLSTSTYIDAKVIETVSLNEKADDEEE